MKVVIALGSNLGNRDTNITGAINILKTFIDNLNVSQYYETHPVGGPDQPNFLNAVAVGESKLDPYELLDRCLEIEAIFGRKREVRWGPRTLDIDLIEVGKLELKSEKLTLPHPMAHERRFVLEPWLEIEPAAELLGKGRIADILAELN
jgi:2-amino-4-hydroxy-6-hydroxymethyldihydropteridine diphosphokinase